MPEIAQSTSIAYSNNFLRNTPPIMDVFLGSDDIETKIQLQNRNSFLSSVKKKEREETLTQLDLLEYKKEEREEILTQLDLLEYKEKEVQNLIYQVRTSFIRHREKLANRLNMLFKDSKEEDPNASGITADSLRNFIKFLQPHENLKYPSISLTPEYNIYASWREDPDRVFSVHFLPNGDARFVIFKPNDRHPERKIRISGTTTTDILMETVSPNKIYDWVLE